MVRMTTEGTRSKLDQWMVLRHGESVLQIGSLMDLSRGIGGRGARDETFATGILSWLRAWTLGRAWANGGLMG